MTEVSLRAFVHKYRLRFPIGIDAHDACSQPVTFSAYGMRGTPTTLLIDREGRLRSHHFGAVEDMSLARGVTQLLHELPGALAPAGTSGTAAGGACAADAPCR